MYSMLPTCCIWFAVQQVDCCTASWQHAVLHYDRLPACCKTFPAHFLCVFLYHTSAKMDKFAQLDGEIYVSANCCIIWVYRLVSVTFSTSLDVRHHKTWIRYLHEWTRTLWSLQQLDAGLGAARHWQPPQLYKNGIGNVQELLTKVAPQISKQRTRFG